MRTISRVDEKRIAFKEKFLNNAPYFRALSHMDKRELIDLLLKFKQDVVEEIKNGKKLCYSARSLFTTLSIKSDVLGG